MNRKFINGFILLIILFSIGTCIIPQTAYCEGGGKDATMITKKIPSEGLGSFNKWWVDMYNEYRVAYALCATGLMMMLGITVGFGTDLILKMFGFKTTKIIHHE